MTPVLEPTEAQSANRDRWWRSAPLGLTLVVYLVLSLWLAGTKAPWFDEGQYANSSYNLAFHGSMGSNVLEPTGMLFNADFRGIQRHTYYTVPNSLVALAGWFRLFGFSIFSARCYSILFGAITLVALFYILQRSFPDRRVAWIGTFFTAIDFVFLWSTADARMDAAANALALSALAVYLHFREKELLKAVLYSQILAAAAVFTHPNATLVILVIMLLAWRFDRQRFRQCGWAPFALAVVPYLVFGLLWSVYILQSPGDFRAQFFANVAGQHSERLTKFLHPDLALISEIERHVAVYGNGGLWGGIMKEWMVLIPLLYPPALIWFLLTSRRQPEPLEIFTTYAVAMILGLTFLNGFKGYFYLIYVLPLYNSVLAAWLLNRWETRSIPLRGLAAALGLAFVAMQIAISVLHIRADEYHRDYLPAVADLVRDRSQGKTILGDAALGFGLRYNGFHDDIRMGMYSGLSPDVLVIDRAYRMYTGYFVTDEPAVFDHVVTMLTTNYRLAAQHGSFWIFERVRPGVTRDAIAATDLSELHAMQGWDRARYLFRQIFAANNLQDAEESSL